MRFASYPPGLCRFTVGVLRPPSSRSTLVWPKPQAISCQGWISKHVANSHLYLIWLLVIWRTRAPSRIETAPVGGAASIVNSLPARQTPVHIFNQRVTNIKEGQRNFPAWPPVEWPQSMVCKLHPSVTSSFGAWRLSWIMAQSAKRSPKMVTIRNLQEMRVAAHEGDPQTKLLVLGLGEAIVTTCGQARSFLESGS